MTPSLVNTALSEWIEPVAKWSFSLLWRWRAGRYESPSRSNGSGRAGIGWEFGWSPQRDGARHKKTEDVLINNSWRLSGWMSDGKFDVDRFTKIAFVAFRGLRIWAARMTKKGRRANFLNRVWSLVKNKKKPQPGIPFLSFRRRRREEEIMPRRTVQEVTVQDVQKRRNPNKHYVSPI